MSPVNWKQKLTSEIMKPKKKTLVKARELQFESHALTIKLISPKLH